MDHLSLRLYTTKLQKIEMKNTVHTGLIVYFFNTCELWMVELWWLINCIYKELLASTFEITSELENFSQFWFLATKKNKQNQRTSGAGYFKNLSVFS